MAALLSIDVGCGGKKQPGTIGLDRLPEIGVDLVCDFDRDPLPLEDHSVGSVFSSHCIEHVADPLRFLREITRVSADGAQIELWHPYSGHRDAFLFDHRSFINEAFYRHISALAPAHWAAQLGGRWRVSEFVFAIDDKVVAELEEAGIDLDFAVKYLSNIVTELGIFATIEKDGAVPERDVEPRRVYATGRAPTARHPLARPASRHLGLRDRLAAFWRGERPNRW